MKLKAILPWALFAVALALLAGVGWAAYRNATALAEADRSAIHTRDVIQQLDRLLSTLKDAETGKRGFLITGEEKYLEPYFSAIGQVSPAMASLMELTRDNPVQQKRLQELEPVIAEKLAELKRTIEARRAEGFDSARQIVLSDIGKALMDDIRNRVSVLGAEEERLLQERSEKKAAETRAMLQTGAVGGLFSVTMLLLGFSLLRKELVQRARAEEEVRRHRDHLEEMVKGRTAELEAEVAERKRAEEALREKEQQFRTLADSIPNLAWWAQGDGYITWYNQRWYEYTGTTPKQMEGWGWQSVHDPEMLPKVLERWKESIATGEAFDMEFPLRGADGRFRVFLTRIHPLKDAQGRVVKWFGTNTDVDELKRAEEALREAHQRLQYHIQNTPLAVIEFDAELRVAAWSDGAQRIFGWEASEVVGRRMWEIPWICEEDREKVGKVSAGLVSGQTLRSVSSNRNLRKDGKVVWCEWHNSTLTDAAGKMRSIQSLVLDVTERNEAEAVLARSKTELERLVAERTERLQELVGELEHFSYTITHDMRAPLRAMRGFAEIMGIGCEDCERKESREFLRRISSSAERMDRLITDALKYSRSVREELPLEDVDSGALLRGMLDTYPEFQAGKAKIEVEGGLPVVLGNEAGLTQCFSNLLGNAVKFAKPGAAPEIRIWGEIREDAATRRGGDAETWVRIYVEDKGIGIAKELLPRLFDMFSRGNKKVDGTGIGLALVRKVTQRMGGRVGVESREGVGSRFWLELRRSESAGLGAGEGEGKKDYETF